MRRHLLPVLVLALSAVLSHGAEQTPSPNRPNIYPALLKKAGGYRTGFIRKYGVGKPPGKEISDFNKHFPGQGQFPMKQKGQTVHLIVFDPRLPSERQGGRTQDFALGIEPRFEELYDLEADSKETSNLATHPEQHHRLQRSRTKLVEMRQSAQ